MTFGSNFINEILNFICLLIILGENSTLDENGWNRIISDKKKTLKLHILWKLGIKESCLKVEESPLQILGLNVNKKEEKRTKLHK